VDNPWAWAALAGLAIFIVLLNVGLISLISALRHKPDDRGGLLGRSLNAVSGARRADDRQKADLDELHRRVAELSKRDE
jgi:hypothetical protein